jgi:hypothetical protein
MKPRAKERVQRSHLHALTAIGTDALLLIS